MPLTPEQKSEHLLRNGYDPTKFELDDDGTTVYEREDQPAFTPSVVAVPQAPPKMSAMEAVKVTAPRAILPTIGGFAGAAALGALAGGPVGAIALPIIGGFGGGYAASKAQEALLPPSEEEAMRLQQARQDQPLPTILAETLPSLLAMKPSLATLREAGGGLRQLSTLGSKSLSAPQIGALSNVGIGATVGGIAEMAGAKLAGEDIDPKRVLGAMAANALITDPNRIGQRVFGFKPVVGSTPDAVSIDNTREIDLANYRAPVPEGPQVPRGWRPLSERQQVYKDIADLDALYEQNAANVAKAQAIKANVEAKKMREYIEAQTKLAEEQTNAEIADIKAQAEMYRNMAKPFVGEEIVKPEAGKSNLTDEAESLISAAESGGVPAFATENLRRIARENGVNVIGTDTPNDIIAQLKAKRVVQPLGKPIKFKRPSQTVAETKPFVGELVEPVEGLAAKAATAPVEVTTEPPRGLGSEVVIEQPIAPLRTPRGGELPKGAGTQKLKTAQEMTARKGKALYAEDGSELTGEQLQARGIETSGVLNKDTRKVAAALADRLGYKYQETTNKMVSNNTGKEVPGQAFTEALIAEVNPTSPNRGPGERGFGLDTPLHELFHIFIEGLRKYGTAFEKKMLLRGEELFGGNERFVNDGGKKSVFDLYDEAHPIKKYMRLLWKHIKLRFGAGSKEDVRDWLIQRMMKAPPKAMEFDAAGRVVPQTGEARTEANGVPATASEGGSQLNKGAKYVGEQPKLDGTTMSLYDTPDGSTVTVETLKKLGYEVPERKVDLSSAEGQQRMAEMKKQLGVADKPVSAGDKKALATLPQQKLAEGGSDLSTRDERVFSTEVEKDLRMNRGSLGKLTPNKEGKLNSNEVLTQIGKYNPGEVELLKQSGIEEFLKANPRVAPQKLANWIKKNGPRVEVIEYGQKGKISKDREKFDAMTHNWFDNLKPTQQGEIAGAILPEDISKKTFPNQADYNNALDYIELRRKVNFEVSPSGPRATSAYNNVSPKDVKEFPVQRVDVVLPDKDYNKQSVTREQIEAAYRNEQISEEEYNELIQTGVTNKPSHLWHPDNIHENVPNTLGWAAIQYETLPSGEKIAHLFEVQSSWGQSKRAYDTAYEAAKKAGMTDAEAHSTGMRAKGNTRGYTPAMDSALLKDYNRLILKAAIDEARKRGAKKIVISDAETAMMTEGHDIYSNYEVYRKDTNQKISMSRDRDIAQSDAADLNEANRTDVYAVRPVVEQEGGMRFNYDEALPRIASELTGDKGVEVNLGEHKNAYSDDGSAYNIKDEPRSNLIFTNPNGTPKTSVTGRMYDIYQPAFRRGLGEPYSLYGKKYAEGGSDLNSAVEQRTTDKTSFAPFMTSQVNKVRKLGETGNHVADKAERFLAKKSLYEGRFGERGAEIVQAAKMDKATDKLMMMYLNDIRHKGESAITPPKELQPMLDALRKHLVEIADYAEQRGVPVVTESGDVRAIKKNPNWIQNMLSSDVAAEWNTNPTSKKSQSYIEKLAKHIADNDKEIKKIKEPTAKFNAAYKIAQQYARAVGKSEAHDSAAFAALRRAAGVGLPWDLMEQSLERAMFRYGRRAARDIAFWEEIQSDPIARYALSVRDEFEKLTPADADIRLPSGGKAQPIDADRDVQALRRTIFGKQIQEMPRIQSAAKLVHSMIMQIPTGLRDMASIPVNSLPYMGMGEGMRYAAKALNSVVTDYKNSFSRARQSGAVRGNLNDFVMGDPDAVKSKLNSMSNFFARYGGREALEGASRTFTYALGEELAKAKFVAARNGDKAAQQLLKRLGSAVDNVEQYFGRNAQLPSADVVARVAKEFTDAVQGGYDARNLPTWAIEGSVAPFVSLQRWGIEKANVIYKDVIKPMNKGNYAPFLRYSLGAMLSGAAIEQLNELVNNARGYDPTIAEVTKSDEADAGDYAKKMVALMQMAGYAGIVSDTAKLAMAAGSGNYSKYNSPLNYPLYSYVTETLAGNLSDYVEALSLGEDPFRVTAQLVEELATQSLQNARMIRNYADASETERKQMNRDYRVWQEMSGRAGAKMTPDYNRFVGVEEREFKTATDPEKIGELAQRLFSRYLNEEDPIKMAERFESLRRMPITWMPSINEKPQDMSDYLSHIEDTQGSRAGSDILGKYATQKQVNQAKKELVPKF